METVLNYAKDTALYVLGTLLHNAPALTLGVLIAAAMQVYLNTEKLRGWLMRRSAVSIPATVAFGAFTPFCACGTMAVVLAMLATALPWGPVMAFLTSSPLMSPEGFVLISGIIGPSFAIALTAASVIIGIGSGYVTHIIEKKTRFLDGQLRLVSNSITASSGESSGSNEVTAKQVCGCKSNDVMAEQVCGCGAPVPLKKRAGGFIDKYRLGRLVKAVFDIGVKRILPYFMMFAAIGYLINRLIPSEWISALFGSNNILSVPLAAGVGLPLYVNGDSALPMIQSLMQSGVEPGAMLAFLITGPGTSAGVMAGLAVIMKKRALALYASFLMAGAVLLGYAYDFMLAFIQ